MNLAERFEQSIEAPRRFFAEHAGRAAEAGLLMARRFARGGRLLVGGRGAQASDAAHVAVEFLHPVLVGKKAFPALALGDNPLEQLEVLGRREDILMWIDLGEGHPALGWARDRGMLTVHLTAGDAGTPAELRFGVDAADPLVIQEVHETLYHVLWELVQLCFEHGVASEGPECSLCGDEARPATVRAVDPAGATADVELDGALRTIGIDLIDRLAPGDQVLVHQGFAIARVDA